MEISLFRYKNIFSYFLELLFYNPKQPCIYQLQLEITLIFTHLYIMQLTLESCSGARQMPLCQTGNNITLSRRFSKLYINIYHAGSTYLLVITDVPVLLLFPQLPSDDHTDKLCQLMMQLQCLVLAN